MVHSSSDRNFRAVIPLIFVLPKSHLILPHKTLDKKTKHNNHPYTTHMQPSLFLYLHPSHMYDYNLSGVAAILLSFAVDYCTIPQNPNLPYTTE
jgi:hypothetical protein